MKKLMILFFLFLCITISSAQELNGIWVVMNENFEEEANVFFPNNSGILINYDNYTMSSFDSELVEKIKINKKKTKIKVKGRKGKLKLGTITAERQEIIGPKKEFYRLEKLDLSSKIEMSTTDLSNFLIDQQCDPIKGLNVSFLAEKNRSKSIQEKEVVRYKLAQNDSDDFGYWHVKKIQENAFMVLSLGRNRPANIFQITSFTLNGFKIDQIQGERELADLVQFKTCL